MQNLPLVESCSTTDTSPCMSARDLAVEAGGMSLDGSDCNMNDRTNNEEISNPGVMQQSVPVVNSSSRSEGDSESSYCTSEPRGSWGDFEGFRESLGKSERFDHNPEISVKSTKTSEGDTDWNGGHCSTSAGHLCSEPSLHSVIQDISSSLNEANHSYEDIFKLGFPEVFVSQSRENIRSLDQVLHTNNEDVGIPELMKNQLCIDSGNIWRTLRDLDNTSRLRHPWSKSHCQENLLSVLGIDANQTDSSKSQDDIFEESNVKDNEDFGFDGFSINNCKALIQTKLPVSPDSRHDLFTCNLFLKTTSSNGNKQYITIPRKKPIFTTQNLKMKFFNNDIC
uniref:Clathrin binding box of aftiphilin containing 1 n=1 Tax=Cairina moschata TaxID=8855 RepID=A0A8C3GEH8_CAIMO